MSNDAQVPFLTQEAYDRLVAELENLSTVGREEIAKRIEVAREEGDLKENGGYHAAKDEQGKIEARIRTLETLLKTAKVSEAPASRGIVEPGTVVTATVAGGEEVLLLGSREIAGGTDLDVYSEASPLGSAIQGLKVGDKTAFSMEQTRFDITPPADGAAMQFSGGARKFDADLTLVEDPKSKAAIEALGYQTISGSFRTEGSWQPSDGKLEMSKNEITVDNAATFGMTFSLGGYTMDFLKSLQEMQKKMAEQPEGADNSAQGMVMLGLLQQLSFNSASIRLDDDSLTNKVLAYVGKQQGMSAKDIANQAKAIVPFGMAQLNNPELTAQVSTAVGKYLDDPKSLQISAVPPAPVPFALIMAGAMANPADLTKTLGVTVKANED